MTQKTEYPWVLAAPFAAHVARVSADADVPWRVIAAVAEVPSRTLQRMMSGELRRIPETMARRLLGIDESLLAQLEGQRIGAGPTATLLARLRSAGYSWTELASSARLSEFEVRRLEAGVTCSAMTALRVVAAADERRVAFVESSGLAA